MANEESSYLVDVVGFNETERLMLSSIFGLAARREPSFLLREPRSAQRTDLYLVDAAKGLESKFIFLLLCGL